MARQRITVKAGAQDIRDHAKTSAALAVAELVWNGLDADATKIAITLDRSADSPVAHTLTVSDDGHGIGPHEMERSFGRHRDSAKRLSRNSPAGRPMHGRLGRGRFRMLAIASKATWTSTAPDELDVLATSLVTVASDQPNVALLDDRSADDKTGTSVELFLLQSLRAKNLTDPSFRSSLESVLAPSLKSIAGVEVLFDGVALNPDNQIDDEQTFTIEADLSKHEKMDGSTAGPVSLSIIEWNGKSRKPVIYLCDERMAALSEFDGSLPKVPGISWSAYLNWEGFGREEVNTGDLQNARSTFPAVLNPALEKLRDHLEERSDQLTGSAIDEWVTDGTYPYDSAPTSAAEEAEQQSFRSLVAIARRAVPKEKEPRRLSLSLLQSAFQENPDDALSILEKIQGLPSSKLEDFRDLLERTSLSHIVSASKEVADRIDLVHALREFLYSEEHRARFLERGQLHHLCEKNPWLFGSEWTLMQSEVSLATAMREHLGRLRPELDDAAPLDGDNRRIDMLLTGTVPEKGRMRRLVVELKRASIALGRTERDQIEDYAQALTADSRFSGGKPVDWEFWLVGTSLRSEISKGLTDGVFNGHKDPDTGDSYTILIRPWSELLEEAQDTLQFFTEELKLDPSVDDALQRVKEAYPDAVPSTMSVE